MPSPRPRIIASLLLTIALVAGCGGAAASVAPSVAPSSAAPSPTATPTPAPTAAPTAAPTPVPSVAVTPADAAAALESYMALATAPDRSFHLHQTGSVAIDGTTVGQVAYDLDVAQGDMAATGSALGQTFAITSVGDRMWVSQGGEWTETPRDDAALNEVLDVFRYTGDPKQLGFVETTTLDDVTVHTFANLVPIPYQTGTMKTMGIVGSIPDLQLVIAADGVPQTIHFATTAEITSGSGTQLVETDSTVEFTEFGKKITIKAPD